VTVPTGGAEGTGGIAAAVVDGMVGNSDGGGSAVGGGVAMTVAGPEGVTTGADGTVVKRGWLVVTPTGGGGFATGGGASTGGEANVGPADMPGP
jgi:hypothetical protein